jgi:prepilin-type N-terminal cleavage/methylation domain-containing protein
MYLEKEGRTAALLLRSFVAGQGEPMSNRSREKAGFTLVELMMVVALVGVLSAIAIPNFMTYQARTRRSEGYVNLASIARSQKSYFAEKDTFHDSAGSWPDPTLLPGGVLTTEKMTWDSDSEDAFGELGWHPEGKVFYSYESTTPLIVPGLSKNCTCSVCFTATAYGDVDGNGLVSALMYVEPEGGGECAALFEGFGTPTRPGSNTPVYNEVAVQRSTDEF